MKIKRFGRAEPLTKAQFNKVLVELKQPHRLIFALCWYTTERPGAVVQLKVEDTYQDVNFRRRPRSTIVIPGSKRKDKRTREVPCTRSLEAELRLYSAPESGWLFPSCSMTGHLSYRAYYSALDRVYKRLGLVGYSPYSTRRGALTHLLRQGISTRRIQDLSGHASLSSLQPYLESTEEDQRRTAELL